MGQIARAEPHLRDDDVVLAGGHFGLQVRHRLDSLDGSPRLRPGWSVRMHVPAGHPVLQVRLRGVHRAHPAVAGRRHVDARERHSRAFRVREHPFDDVRVLRRRAQQVGLVDRFEEDLPAGIHLPDRPCRADEPFGVAHRGGPGGQAVAARPAPVFPIARELDRDHRNHPRGDGSGQRPPPPPFARQPSRLPVDFVAPVINDVVGGELVHRAEVGRIGAVPVQPEPTPARRAVVCEAVARRGH